MPFYCQKGDFASVPSEALVTTIYGGAYAHRLSNPTKRILDMLGNKGDPEHDRFYHFVMDYQPVFGEMPRVYKIKSGPYRPAIICVVPPFETHDATDSNGCYIHLAMCYRKIFACARKNNFQSLSMPLVGCGAINRYDFKACRKTLMEVVDGLPASLRVVLSYLPNPTSTALGAPHDNVPEEELRPLQEIAENKAGHITIDYSACPNYYSCFLAFAEKRFPKDFDIRERILMIVYDGSTGIRDTMIGKYRKNQSKPDSRTLFLYACALKMNFYEAEALFNYFGHSLLEDTLDAAVYTQCLCGKFYNDFERLKEYYVRCLAPYYKHKFARGEEFSVYTKKPATPMSDERLLALPKI